MKNESEEGRRGKTDLDTFTQDRRREGVPKIKVPKEEPKETPPQQPTQENKEFASHESGLDLPRVLDRRLAVGRTPFESPQRRQPSDPCQCGQPNERTSSFYDLGLPVALLDLDLLPFHSEREDYGEGTLPKGGALVVGGFRP